MMGQPNMLRHCCPLIAATGLSRQPACLHTPCSDCLQNISSGAEGIHAGTHLHTARERIIGDADTLQGVLHLRDWPASLGRTGRL